MSWNRRWNKDKKQQDKREACLVLRMLEQHRETVKHFAPSPMQRDLLRTMEGLEAKARATWSK